MTRTYILCDLCGKDVFRGHTNFHYELRRKLFFHGGTIKEKLDICDSCWEKLETFVKESRNDNQTDE